jgi:uncharacterized protein (AIM24 family)
MATIITKNSQTASAVPSAASLQVGELAVNTADGKLYTEHTGGVVKEIIPSTVVDGGITPTKLSTGGIYWNTSGNVGVGTTSPDNKLVVNGALSFSYNPTLSIHGLKLNGLKTEYFAGATSTGSHIIHEFTGSSGVAKVSITEGGDFRFNSGYGSVATAYGCRAWVNFNGTGTVAIRASGNVSSITDNGTGNYTVNFNNAMTDANYAFVATCGGVASNAVPANVGQDTSSTQTTTAVVIRVAYDGGGGPAPADTNVVNVSIYR